MSSHAIFTSHHYCVHGLTTWGLNAYSAIGSYILILVLSGRCSNPKCNSRLMRSQFHCRCISNCIHSSHARDFAHRCHGGYGTWGTLQISCPWEWGEQHTSLFCFCMHWKLCYDKLSFFYLSYYIEVMHLYNLCHNRFSSN